MTDDKHGVHDHDLVPSDSRVRAFHRAHQGRWRSDEIGVPMGPGNGRDRVDSMLPERHLGRNLMSDNAIEYAKHRIDQVKSLGGTVDADRLWRNMLSSQPIAFSVAGELRAHPEAAVAVLGELTGRTFTGFDRIGTGDGFDLDGLQAEWAPKPDRALGDRSAADLAAALRIDKDRRFLITVEVKYTEPFSRTALRDDNPLYDEALSALGLSAQKRALHDDGCTQFLRSVMLTDAVRPNDDRDDVRDDVLAVVLGREDDSRARSVVQRLGEAQSRVPVSFWSLREFTEACARQPALADWAARMAERYCPTLTR